MHVDEAMTAFEGFLPALAGQGSRLPAPGGSLLAAGEPGGLEKRPGCLSRWNCNLVQAVSISWKCTNSDAAMAGFIQSCKHPMTQMLM